jgi:flagellar biosynthesis/type III secretory pathway chaperone
VTTEIVDIIRSLTLIMNEETQRLSGADRSGVLAEMAAAKARLVGMLEAKSAALARSDPDWIEALEAEQRAELMEALAAMKEASAPNAAILERQITLSLEMIAAVAAEAKRLSGSRSAVYGRSGGLSRTELTAPISVNSRL